AARSVNGRRSCHAIRLEWNLGAVGSAEPRAVLGSGTFDRAHTGVDMSASPPDATIPTAKRPRSFAFQVLALLALGLAPILVLELIARFAGFGTRPMYVPEGDLLWTLIPNQRVLNHVSCRPVTIDARGMRVVPGAPDNGDSLQVLCFGNSITFGYGVADSETYESLLQRELERREPGRWRFLNAGVMGYNMYYERLRLRELLDRGVRPDVIVVGFCFNELPTWPGEHFPPPDRERIKKSIHFKNAMRHVGLYNFYVERLMTQSIYRWRRKYLPFGFG